MPDFTNTIKLIDEEILGILAADAPCSNKEEGIESHAYFEDIPDIDKERIDLLLERRYTLMGR